MDIREQSLDQAFVEKLGNAETLEEAVGILAEKGVAVTEEELRKLLTVPQADASGELSEDALDDVAGGASIWNILRRLIPTIGGPIRPILPKRPNKW